MTIELSGARAFQEQLDALAKKFAQDYRNGDADACAMAYSEDGMRIEPGMPPRSDALQLRRQSLQAFRTVLRYFDS